VTTEHRGVTVVRSDGIAVFALVVLPIAACAHHGNLHACPRTWCKSYQTARLLGPIPVSGLTGF